MSDPLVSYRLNGILPLDDFEEMAASTNLLLVGEDIEALRALGVHIVSVGVVDDEGILIVSMEDAIEGMVDRYSELSGDADCTSLSLINCSGESTVTRDLGDDQLWMVDSPGSLTDLGISFIEYEDQRAVEFDGVRVLFDSITTLLAHLEEERAFEFVDAFLGRIATSQMLGVWLLDASANEESTVRTFMELFDEVVEVQRVGEHLEVRRYDVSTPDASWTTVGSD